MRPDFETRVAAAKRAIRATSLDGIQRRHFTLDKVEVRDSADGGYTIVGHGAVFNSLSENLGGFREQIAPGAFSDVLAGNGPADARALANHDQNLVLAAVRNGTLGLVETGHGLRYEARVSPAVAQTYYGQATRTQLAEGLVDQSSFAFRVARMGDTWDEDEETGGLIRTVNKVSALYDVSPVTYPAYPAADSGLRAVRMDVPSVQVLSQMIALGTQFIRDESEDGDEGDRTAMEGIINALTSLLGLEAAEEASTSQSTEEREAKADALEQGSMASADDERVSERWRLNAVKRRTRLRELAAK